MFKLPFKCLPASWGLKGKSYDIAEAEYHLTGYDLELRLLEINQDSFDDGQYLKAVLDLKFKYEKISTEEYRRGLVALIRDPVMRGLAELELDHRAGVITDTQFAKQTATLKGEPWVTVVGMDFSKSSALEGSFELDWNEFFVDKLKAEGYTGPKPDNIVNAWFMEVCRNVAMEEFDGTGNFTGDSEANLDAVMRWNRDAESTGRKAHH